VVSVLVFSWVFCLYTAHLFCSPSFTSLCWSCTETWLLVIIYLPIKKLKKKKLEIRVDFKRWCLDELILAYLIII
jgi:hypothetical protein